MESKCLFDDAATENGHSQSSPDMSVSARPWEYQVEALERKLKARICTGQAFSKKSETSP